jgi:transcriptional regulator with XRE-family HTH domain
LTQFAKSFILWLVLNRDELYKKLADGIRKHRETEDLSQEDLASRAGLSRAQLANIEKQRQRPPLDVLYKLAGALNVDVTELLPRQDEVIAVADQVTMDYAGDTVNVTPAAASYLRGLGNSQNR